MAEKMKKANSRQKNPEQGKRGQKKLKEEKPEEEPEEAVQAKPMITCFSCRAPHNIRAFPKCLPSAECTHGREMCRMCAIAWILPQLEADRMPVCALCKGKMCHEFVESVTSKEHDQEIFKR